MFKKTFYLLIILLLALWVLGYGLFVTGVLAKTPGNTEEKTDAIIVLTGGNNRVLTGLSLLSSGLSQKLFITGVHQSVKKEDIISLWENKGTSLPDCCIVLGHKATTTRENALEAKEWIETQNIKTIRLVTSAYHIDRALLEFRQIIEDIRIIVHPIERQDHQLKDPYFWKITFSEYNKILFRAAIITLENAG